MPVDSKVHHVFEALKKEGHSEESAARIAQAQTGEALATGKPPKHKEENCSLENANSLEIGQQIKEARKKADAIYKEMQKSPEAYERLKGSHEKAKKEQERLIDLGFKAGNSFQNGRTRALNHIMNRAANVGVKLENAGHDFSKGWGSNYESREYMQGWKDGKGDDVKFQQSPYPAGIAKKDWERGWQDGYKAKHNQPNTSRMG